MDEIYKIEQVNKKIIINYRIGLEACNLKCPYCWGTFREKRKKVLPYMQLYGTKIHKNINTFILYLKKKYGYEIDLCFKGGEPSLLNLSIYRNFVDNVNINNIDKIIFATNLTRSEDYYIYLNKIFNGNITIDAAYHDVYPDSFENFTNKIKTIQDNGVNIYLHFTCNDSNFIGEEKVEELKSKGINVDFVKLIDKQNLFDDKKEIHNEFLKNYFTKKSESKKYIINDEKIISRNEAKKLSFENQNLYCLQSSFVIEIIKSNKFVVALTTSTCDYRKYKIDKKYKTNLEFSKKNINENDLDNYFEKSLFNCNKKHDECTNINCNFLYACKK